MATEYLNNRKFEILISNFINVKRDKTKYELLLEDIKQTEIRTACRKKYQKPETWSNLENKFVEITDEYNSIQQELTVAFYLLSENIVYYRKFNLIDPDDAIQEGVMICFEKIDRFDPSKGKAFNYMTTCIINHFRQLYRAARNYNELKKKYHDHLQIQLDQPIPPAKQNNQSSNYKVENVNFRY